MADSFESQAEAITKIFPAHSLFTTFGDLAEGQKFVLKPEDNWTGDYLFVYDRSWSRQRLPGSGR